MTKEQKPKYRLIHHCRFCPDKYQIRISFEQVGHNTVAIGHGQHYVGKMPIKEITNREDWTEDILMIRNCPYCLQSLDILFRRYQQNLKELNNA